MSDDNSEVISVLKSNVDIMEDVLGASTDKTKPMNPFLALLGFLAASVGGGFIVAALVLPMVIPVAAAPTVGREYWSLLPKDLPEIELPQRSYIYSGDNKRIATFYSENRIEVDLADVSQNVIDALISTEDARFYEHDGVDWRGVARAVRNNATMGKNEGASTITQQLVKNTLILSASERDDPLTELENRYARKIDEISYAVALEDTKTKDEILEAYLNTVLFSNGVYGIGTASQYYFNLPPSELSIAQSATLIGLLKSPSQYNPITHPDASVARRNVVIGRMLTTNVITKEEAEEAKAQELVLDVTKTPNGCGDSPYPFYCQWVVDNLMDDERLGDTPEDRAATLRLGGLKVTTTLDPEKQDILQADVDKMFGRSNRVAIGVAMVEPGTGNVLAMAQNRDWGEGVNKETGAIATQIVLPATPAFQSGSAFKPVTLAAALESGLPPDAKINAPTVFNPPDMNVPKGGIKNLSSANSGVLSINKATALSSNTWYAQLQYLTGTLTVAEMGKNLGISMPDNITPKDASLTLGTTDTSPLEMSAAYATFAAGGVYCAPRGVESITSDISEIKDEVSNCRQAVSRSTASTITKALVETIDGEEEYRTGERASIGRPAGGKSGTTNSHSAAWFVGYTPELSTAVWIGDPRGGFKYPLTGGVRFNGRNVYNVYASDIAAPAWKRVMTNSLSGTPKTKFDLGASNVSSPTVVPDVRGQSLAAAIGTLKSQGFKVTVSPDTVAKPQGFHTGQVFSQSPIAGKKVFNVTEVNVTLTVTQGTAIPDIIE